MAMHTLPRVEAMGKDRCANPPLLYRSTQMCPPPVLVLIKHGLTASKWRCTPYQRLWPWGETGARVPLRCHYYYYYYYYYYYNYYYYSYYYYYYYNYYYYYYYYYYYFYYYNFYCYYFYHYNFYCYCCYYYY